MAWRQSWLAALIAVALCNVGVVADPRWAAFQQPGWEAVEDKITPETIVVILALKQSNVEFLEDRARHVTDPDSAAYGAYYTSDELKSLIGPSDAQVDIVREFLSGTPGRTQFSEARDMVRYVCTVSCVEKVFGTKIKKQQRPTAPGTSPYRAVAPISLPAEVADALDGVSLNAPIFMPPRPKQPVRQAFQYPASHRYAPRINPYLFDAGDAFVTLRFVPYCLDGHPNAESLENGEQRLCQHRGDIVSFEIEILQDASQKVVQLPVTSELLGQRPAECGGQPCFEFNTTVGNIQNFAKTTARIRSHFAGGGVSDFSDPTEVWNVYPLPYTTPTLLANLYGLPLNKPIRDPRNIISVAEFLGQYYNPADLETFFQYMGVRSWEGEGTTQPTLTGSNNPFAGSVLGGEAQLDIQYIMGLAPNVTTSFWSVPGSELTTQQEPFLDWLMQVADTPDDKMTLVHSVSYGDKAEPMPIWFKRRCDVEFMKLALRGVSVLIASGDDGASGTEAQEDLAACSQSHPEYPAGSPWVTAIGATQLANAFTPVCSYTSDNVIVRCQDEREVVCSSSLGGHITSGGGFSEDAPRPWYQKEAVEKYLRQQDNPVPPIGGAWKYNVTGRGYPDISALGNNFLVWMGDHFTPVSGTSASTPLVAAMVARLNEERLEQGMPPLGFLNPLIYKLGSEHPEVFNDVVVGDNRCTAAGCCEIGFGAARGWDAATGFGSLKVDVAMKMLSPKQQAEEAATYVFAEKMPPARPPPSRSSLFAAAGVGAFAGMATLGMVAAYSPSLSRS